MCCNGLMAIWLRTEHLAMGREWVKTGRRNAAQADPVG